MRLASPPYSSVAPTCYMGECFDQRIATSRHKLGDLLDLPTC